MNEPKWILDDIVLAIHSMLLAEHGGGEGIRDKGLLSSALARPKQKFSYNSECHMSELAAAYSFGIARNHPFVDGNKRTAFTIGTLFLELNGYQLTASEVAAAIAFEKLASGELDEKALTLWFDDNCTKN